MAPQTDHKLRYLVHFRDVGTAIRSYDAPLEEAELFFEGDEEYVATRVDRPEGADSLGHAWAQLAEPVEENARRPTRIESRLLSAATR